MGLFRKKKNLELLLLGIPESGKTWLKIAAADWVITNKLGRIMGETGETLSEDRFFTPYHEAWKTGTKIPTTLGRKVNSSNSKSDSKFTWHEDVAVQFYPWAINPSLERAITVTFKDFAGDAVAPRGIRGNIEQIATAYMKPQADLLKDVKQIDGVIYIIDLKSSPDSLIVKPKSNLKIEMPYCANPTHSKTKLEYSRNTGRFTCPASGCNEVSTLPFLDAMYEPERRRCAIDGHIMDYNFNKDTYFCKKCGVKVLDEAVPPGRVNWTEETLKHVEMQGSVYNGLLRANMRLCSLPTLFVFSKHDKYLALSKDHILPLLEYTFTSALTLLRDYKVCTANCMSNVTHYYLNNSASPGLNKTDMRQLYEFFAKRCL